MIFLRKLNYQNKVINADRPTIEPLVRLGYKLLGCSCGQGSIPHSGEGPTAMSCGHSAGLWRGLHSEGLRFCQQPALTCQERRREEDKGSRWWGEWWVGNFEEGSVQNCNCHIGTPSFSFRSLFNCLPKASNSLPKSMLISFVHTQLAWWRIKVFALPGTFAFSQDIYIWEVK